MRDAYGRKRSARSLPTGKGSREGGLWTRDRNAYYREWRVQHPEYRDREKERRRRAKAARRDALERDVTLSDACKRILLEEHERPASWRTVGNMIGSPASVVRCWVMGTSGWTAPSVLATTIDVIVMTFTMDRVLRTMAQLRRERRVRIRAGESVQLARLT